MLQVRRMMSRRELLRGAAAVLQFARARAADHAEVCQYESTPDRPFLMDWRPTVRNVLLLGGRSGQSFTMGPAIGEMAARLPLGDSLAVPLFAYERLRNLPRARRT